MTSTKGVARSWRPTRGSHAGVAGLCGLALVAGLTGCTSNGSPDGRGDRPHEATGETTPEPFVTGACVDGTAAVVVEAGAPETVFTDACDTVSVIGTGGTVSLGTVRHLVVEGTKLAVVIDSVELVDFAGDDNTVSHAGTAPVVNENGTTGSVVTSR